MSPSPGPCNFNLLSVSEELPRLTLHICEIIQHVAFGVWLLLLSKMLSSFIRIVGLQHFLAPGASLMEDNFSMDWNWEVVLVSPTAHLLLCSLFLTGHGPYWSMAWGLGSPDSCGIMDQFQYFLFTANIPLCGHTKFCLSIHLLMDIWVVSAF